MIVVSRIKSNCLSLEICQSQYERDTYFAVVINISKVVWTQGFDNKQIAEQKGQAMFKAFCLTEKYLDLSERAYQKALFAQEDGELGQADIFLKKAFFYKKRYHARRIMGLSIE
jgi:hypothetical protein